jgi:hypothetical protein
MTIRSRVFERGNENESSAITDYGVGERGLFKYCKATKTVLPIAEARALDAQNEENTKLASVSHGFIQDEMEPTKHPIDGKYYTSKAKFRTVTRAHGYDEVGTAYDNGFNPEKQAEKDFNNYIKGVNQEWKNRYRES